MTREQIDKAFDHMRSLIESEIAPPEKLTTVHRVIQSFRHQFYELNKPNPGVAKLVEDANKFCAEMLKCDGHSCDPYIVSKARTLVPELVKALS